MYYYFVYIYVGISNNSYFWLFLVSAGTLDCQEACWGVPRSFDENTSSHKNRFIHLDKNYLKIVWTFPVFPFRHPKSVTFFFLSGIEILLEKKFRTESVVDKIAAR